jgi:hypothetical protein
MNYPRRLPYSFTPIVGACGVVVASVYSLSAFSYAPSASRKHASSSLAGLSLHAALARA